MRYCESDAVTSAKLRKMALRSGFAEKGNWRFFRRSAGPAFAGANSPCRRWQGEREGENKNAGLPKRGVPGARSSANPDHDLGAL